MAHDAETQKRLDDIMAHPSYQLAYKDADFIGSEDLRPLRLEMELLKPEMMMDKFGIESTIVVFGGTQVSPREEGERLMAEAKEAIAKNPESPTAKRLICLLYTSPSPRDQRGSRMPSSA